MQNEFSMKTMKSNSHQKMKRLKIPIDFFCIIHYSIDLHLISILFDFIFFIIKEEKIAQNHA